MKKQTKYIVINNVLIGIIYALIMAGFDFANNKDFNIVKFIFNLSFFSIAMGLKDYYTVKKQK